MSPPVIGARECGRLSFPLFTMPKIPNNFLVNLTLEFGFLRGPIFFGSLKHIWPIHHKRWLKKVVTNMFKEICFGIYMNEHLAQTQNLHESPIESPNRRPMGAPRITKHISHLSGEHPSMYRLHKTNRNLWGGQAAEAYSLLDQGKIAGRALIDMGE